MIDDWLLIIDYWLLIADYNEQGDRLHSRAVATVNDSQSPVYTFYLMPDSLEWRIKN